MTRLVWLQLELVATSLDLSWPPNNPLSPRPINTINWISLSSFHAFAFAFLVVHSFYEACSLKRGAFQPLSQVTYSRPRYHLCTNLTLSALLASYISPTTHDSCYIGTIHQTNLVPRGRDPYVQWRGSLVTEALGTRLQWNQSQDCFSTRVTIHN